VTTAKRPSGVRRDGDNKSHIYEKQKLNFFAPELIGPIILMRLAKFEFYAEAIWRARRARASNIGGTR
jgi:hypothetical protein